MNQKTSFSLTLVELKDIANGKSFIAVTVTVKESSTLNPLEVPRTVIVALPF